MKAKSFLNRFDLSWVNLRKIGDTKFVNSMYIWIFLVPLIIKIFEELIEKEEVILIVFQYPFLLNLELPFSWKTFYFSALSLAISNVIIKIKCPKIIQDHITYQSFQNEGKTIKQLSIYSQDISFDWRKLATEVDETIAYFLTHNKTKPGVSIYSPKLNTEDPVHYFWPIFQKAEYLRSNYRHASTIFFMIGFLLFTYVIFQNIYMAISFMVK